jgi:signal transduction histidine kinase
MTRSGRMVHLEANISPAELHEQAVALVIARDVTERRRMEREHQQLQEQFAHSQRLQAVGHLAGGIAHDFNNLLHTIRGSLDRLTTRQVTPDAQADLLANISEATNRASTLTAQLLGFARKGKYKRERIRVAALVENARVLFEPVAHRGTGLKVIVAPSPMEITGDATQLQQVLLNLLLNARDAVEGKGDAARIVVRAEPAATFMPGWQGRPDPGLQASDYVCIRVKDNGVGIAEDVRPKIFEPFFTTKGVGKGTGMGLAMAYGCVANHHGWIHVESDVGRGTEFLVFLPRSGPDE